MKAFKKVFFGFHFIVIITMAVPNSIESTTSFYDIELGKRLKSILKFVNDFSYSRPIYIYSKIAGTNTGYGFYAPNVKAPATAYIETENDIVYPQLSTHEGNHMLNTLIGGMTNQIVRESENVNNTGKTVESAINEIILKNIGIYTFTKIAKKNTCKDFQLHYCIVNYPDLSEHLAGSRDVSLLRTKTIHISNN